MYFVAVNASSSGNNTIVSAITGRKIRVVNYTLISAAAVTVTWKSGSSTNISGPMALAANGGMAPSSSALTPAGMIGVFETSSGESLVLNLGSAIAVGGHLTYILA
jgi:hypothetical protein